MNPETIEDITLAKGWAYDMTKNFHNPAGDTLYGEDLRAIFRDVPAYSVSNVKDIENVYKFCLEESSKDLNFDAAKLIVDWPVNHEIRSYCDYLISLQVPGEENCRILSVNDDDRFTLPVSDEPFEFLEPMPFYLAVYENFQLIDNSRNMIQPNIAKAVCGMIINNELRKRAMKDSKEARRFYWPGDGYVLYRGSSLDWNCRWCVF